MLFNIRFHCDLSHDTEWSSLCYTVGPCCPYNCTVIHFLHCAPRLQPYSWGYPSQRWESPVALSVWLGPYFPVILTAWIPIPGPQPPSRKFPIPLRHNSWLFACSQKYCLSCFQQSFINSATVTEVIQGNPPSHHLDSQKSQWLERAATKGPLTPKGGSHWANIKVQAGLHSSRSSREESDSLPSPASRGCLYPWLIAPSSSSKPSTAGGGLLMSRHSDSSSSAFRDLCGDPGLPRWLQRQKTCLPVQEDVRDMGSIPGWGRSPGGGHGNPLQYSCLENAIDRGSWQGTIHRVAKSQIRLKQFSMHTCKPWFPQSV